MAAAMAANKFLWLRELIILLPFMLSRTAARAAAPGNQPLRGIIGEYGCSEEEDRTSNNDVKMS
jgi:hypothetical protein